MAVAAQRIEARALIAALGAADAVVLVDLDDIAAHAAGDLAQLALLIGRGLIDGGDAKVKNSTFHAQAPARHCEDAIILFCIKNQSILHTRK